jgi:hypothetical protein
MRYLGLDVDDYDKLLDKDTKLIKLDICNFITYSKEIINHYAIDLATNGVVFSDAIRYVQTKVNHLNTIITLL